MKPVLMLVLSVLACLAGAARANTVVEVLGRVSGTSLDAGPWSGVHAGDYLFMTYELVDTGTVPAGSSCGSNLMQYALVPGSLHVTVHGVQMDAPLVGGGGYLSPTCYVADNCPLADVLMFANGATLASPGTGTARYAMVFELHNSTGFAWGSSTIGLDVGSYAASTFDYVEWNVSYPTDLTGFSLQLLALNINPSGNLTGACCLGDGYCAVTSAGACASGQWALGVPCSSAGCAPAGACCFPGGGCDVMTQAACEAIQYAVYEGDGSLCENVTCPETGRCCLGQGVCAVATQAACVGSGGSWSQDAIGWLGVAEGCDIQPQQYHPVLANLPDATGTTTPGVFTDSLTPADPTTVQSVELWLGIGLPRINDVRIRLTGPNGVTLELVTRIGATPPDCTTTPVGPGYAMFDTLVLEDAAGQTFYDHVLGQPAGTYVSGGRFRPAGCVGTPVSLDAASPAGFGGIPIAGTWTLEIRDERPGIQTYLNAWGLSFNGGNAAPCTRACGSADFNCDGDVGTDTDIEGFFACLAGNCPPPPCTGTADFDGNGDVGTDADLEAFFRVLAGGTC